MEAVEVLRIGHRPVRDARATTHVCLAARTLGVRRVWVSASDTALEERMKKVTAKFGGDFSVVTGVNWRRKVQEFSGAGGTVVHLTMYGEGLRGAMRKVPADRPLLIVVGSEKVPADLYRLADLNIAVGHQPHSEIAALAVFLDRLTGGAWEGLSFGGEMQILPCARGKRVRKKVD